MVCCIWMVGQRLRLALPRTQYNSSCMPGLWLHCTSSQLAQAHTSNKLSVYQVKQLTMLYMRDFPSYDERAALSLAASMITATVEQECTHDTENRAFREISRYMDVIKPLYIYVALKQSLSPQRGSTMQLPRRACLLLLVACTAIHAAEQT